MQNILYVQTAFLGDLLLSVPTLKKLRALYPNAKIHLVCRNGLGAFFVEKKLIDYVYEVKKGNSKTYQEIKKSLLDINFDLLVSPHESIRTMLFSRSIKAKNKISYSRWYQRLAFNKMVERPMHLPEALRQLYLLTLISEEVRNEFKSLDASIDWRNISASKIPVWASASIDKVKKDISKNVCLAPGSVWATKMWPKEYYAHLATSLIKKGFTITLIGAENERAVCDWIESKEPKVNNKVGATSLTDLIAIYEESVLLVSNDSGPMHMAALVDLPTVCIFGPTVLSFGYRPWQNNVKLSQIDLACRPCGKHGHDVCPIGTHDCMKMIEVRMVEEQVMELLL